MNKVEEIFDKLMGKGELDFIKANNDVEIYEDPFEYKTIRIDFKEVDGKGDVVIYESLGFEIRNEQWFSDNCIEDKYFDSYNELKTFKVSIEQDIINNGSSNAKLM